MDLVRTRVCQLTFRPLRTSETYTEQLQPQVWRVDGCPDEQELRLWGSDQDRRGMCCSAHLCKQRDLEGVDRGKWLC